MAETNESAKASTMSWHHRRRLLNESRHLQKEAHRLLRKFSSRLKEEIVASLEQALTDLETAQRAKDVSVLEDRYKQLDMLLDKHLSAARKSATREYIESIAVAVIIALLLRAFVIEAFKIPSGSMIPTLKVGDHIFVNKFIYGVRIPWTMTKILEGSPNRGDVVVFINPVEVDKDFIKRVVAIGGDTVSVKDNIVYVNGKALPRREIDGACSYPDTEEGIEEWYVRSCKAYIEENQGVRYKVIQNELLTDPRPEDFDEVRVPEGHIFVMGDNRDNSSDSRNPKWTFVPNRNIKGKALVIWFSKGVPEGVRWSRFFQSVHKFDDGPVLP